MVGNGATDSEFAFGNTRNGDVVGAVRAEVGISLLDGYLVASELGALEWNAVVAVCHFAF